MNTDLDLSNVPGRPALVGVGGSHAYGLATEDSDTDYRGFFVAPTHSHLGLDKPQETYDRNDPDVALHEVGKFIRLCLAANPTVLEVLFYSDYVIRDDFGDLLIEHRQEFITNKIRTTHIGYARSQFSRLERRQGTFSPQTVKRTAKHARHLLRLVRQAERALKTGEFRITVDDRDEIFAFGELPYEEMIRQAEDEINRLSAVDSVLPEESDKEFISEMLVAIRLVDLNS